MNLYVFLVFWMVFSAEAQTMDSKNENLFPNLFNKGLHSPCQSGWAPYGNDYCIKLIDQKDSIRYMMPYNDAKETCKKIYEGRLISIHDDTKQSYVEAYLRLKEVVDNVWIGLEFKDDEKMRWLDGTKPEFSNWLPGRSKQGEDYCVQILTDSKNFGNWSAATCGKANLALCEKFQRWSLVKLQKNLIALSKNFNEISQNYIPIGYVYTQYPWQKDPRELYPLFEWEDITSSYNSAFFRVVGGDANSFGYSQSQQAPRTASVRNDDFHRWNYNFQKKAISVPKHGWSPYLYCGSWGVLVRNSFHEMSFHDSGGEVRPKNMAIKIWRRKQ